jgi:hypothetical protein
VAVPLSLRGKRVFFQFSNRSEVSNETKGSGSISSSSSTIGSSGTGGGHHGHSDALPNTILLVSIQDARLKVTIENLHQIFSPYGQVLRIVTFFTRTHELKALVQMDSIEAATMAKTQLEGKDIFLGNLSAPPHFINIQMCTINMTHLVAVMCH